MGSKSAGEGAEEELVEAEEPAECGVGARPPLPPRCSRGLRSLGGCFSCGWL